LTAVLGGMKDTPDRLPATLTAIDYLWQTHQYEQADKLLQPLLADKEHAKPSWLWRLGAQLAAQRKQTVRSFVCFEQALDIEYQQLPDFIEVETVRRDYSTLLAHYENLANAMATLQQEPPRDFSAKVVRAADRWRLLDTDGTAACQAASRILKTVGVHDLAWDYLTTPMSQHANQVVSWTDLANSFAAQNEFELADRGYAAAFESDPSNPQPLWQRITCLQQLGKPAEARQLLKQIANGTWQQPYHAMQADARRQLDSGAPAAEPVAPSPPPP